MEALQQTLEDVRQSYKQVLQQNADLTSSLDAARVLLFRLFRYFCCIHLGAVLVPYMADAVHSGYCLMLCCIAEP